MPGRKAPRNITARKAARRVLNARKVKVTRLDPTRTLTLRKAFAKELRRKFALLKGKIVKAVVVEDVFGLRAVHEVSNAAEDQPRDEHGRWVGGLKAAIAVGKEAVKARGAALLAKLPDPLKSAGLLLGKAYFAGYLLGNAAVKAVARERGLSEDQAHKLAVACTTADNVLGGGRAITAAKLAGLPTPLALATGFVPWGSAAYLAYSTARDPLATLRAAKGAVARVQGVVGKGLGALGFSYTYHPTDNVAWAWNSFCPTGPGGGVDPTCSFGGKHGGEFTRGDGSAPAVHVKDDPSTYGKQQYDLRAPNGSPVRGTPISPDDPRIPDTLYHMTGNLPAVTASGYLRSAGEGGLGGDQADQIVSMTVDKAIAEALVRDTKFAAAVARSTPPAPERKWNGKEWVGDRSDWGRELVAKLNDHAESQGWGGYKPVPLQLESYNFDDHLRSFFSARETETKGQYKDPQFWDANKTLKGINPDHVGLVEIPKAALKTGAMLTDFDLGNRYGLQEVRMYGDVPLSKGKSTKNVTTNADHDDYDAIASFLQGNGWDDWAQAVLYSALEDGGGAGVHDAVVVARQAMQQSPTENTRWQPLRDPEKVKAFQDWLATQFTDTLTGADSKELWRKYAEAGYRKGAARAFDDTNVARRAVVTDQRGADFYAGGRDEFLRSAFGRPVAVERIELLAARSFDDLENVTDDLATRLSRSLADGLVSGASPHEVARDMAADLDLSRQRAELIARTEIIRAHADGQLMSLKAMGVAQVGVDVEFTTADGACPECAALQGAVYEIDEASGVIPVHPNAVFAGSTFVPYGECEELVRAWYSGPAIVLTLQGGRDRTTIGPNHPMMTRRGMVPAAELREGDEVLYDLRHDHPSSAAGKANFKQVPTVEDVFRACALVSNGAGVSRSSSDLHGDRVFCQGEVEAVTPARGLLIEWNSGGIEQFRERGFVGADADLEAVAGVGAGEEFLLGPPHATDGVMRSLRQPQPLFGGSGSHPSEHALALVSRTDAGLEQPSVDGAAGTLEPLGKRVATCALNEQPNDFGGGKGETVLGRFVWRRVHSVEFSHYKGWAFDATTATSLYCSGGYVVSNCQCAWVPHLPAGLVDDAGDTPEGGEGDTTENAFCPTGPGGGVDPTCSPHGGSLSGPHATLHNALAASGLSLAQREQSGEAVTRVLGKMPPAALGLLHDGLKGVTFHADTQGVTDHWRRVTGQVSREGAVNGFYHHPDGEAVLNGPTRKTQAPGMGGDQVNTHGTYAHELTHAIDRNGRFSLTDEWWDAYSSEIDTGSPKPTLSNYARTHGNVEGFAEFGRALYGSDVPREVTKARFPKCYKFFEDRGLV